MQFDQLEQSTRQALSDLREMLVELRGRPLGDEDLVKLVKHGILERRGNRRHIDYELTVATDWPERIPVQTATELNRIVQEAIENGVRHSGANKIVVALSLSAVDRLSPGHHRGQRPRPAEPGHFQREPRSWNPRHARARCLAWRRNRTRERAGRARNDSTRDAAFQHPGLASARRLAALAAGNHLVQICLEPVERLGR